LKEGKVTLPLHLRDGMATASARDGCGACLGRKKNLIPSPGNSCIVHESGALDRARALAQDTRRRQGLPQWAAPDSEFGPRRSPRFRILFLELRELAPTRHAARSKLIYHQRYDLNLGRTFFPRRNSPDLRMLLAKTSLRQKISLRPSPASDEDRAARAHRRLGA